MGISRYYSKDLNFLLTRIAGDIDDDDLFEHVIALNKETQGISNLREIADCRELTGIGSLTGPGTARAAMKEENKPGCFGVILVPIEKGVIYGMARAYQTFAQEHRESVEIYWEINEALKWLTTNTNLKVEAIRAFMDECYTIST